MGLVNQMELTKNGTVVILGRDNGTRKQVLLRELSSIMIQWLLLYMETSVIPEDTSSITGRQ